MKTPTKTTLLFCLFLSHFAYGSDYYWVGGSGDFSDLSHWATSSGGNDFYTTVPSADDNVYFDANSFTAPGQLVNVTSNAVCRSMDWTGANNPVFSNYLDINDPNHGYFLVELRIFGSLTLIPGMNFPFNGKVYFEATSPGNTIDMEGKNFNYLISFRGIGGGWTLLSDLHVIDSLSLENGSLNTNDFNVQCRRFGSEYTGIRSLILGNSTIVVDRYFRVSSVNMGLDCGTSLIRIIGYNADFTASNALSFHRLIFTNDTSSDLKLNGNSTFKCVKFLGGGKITGNNTFDTLVFTPGKMYTIDTSKTETIIENWDITGSCAGRITINSSVSGTNCTFLKVGGIITSNYLVLKDVWAAGGAIFSAGSSIDLGNNNGWTIISPATISLFWVGNGGNWDDPAHWSFSSGGPGSACTPSLLDNVFFDQNSFTVQGQKVVISDADAFCHNMDWTGVQNNPELSGTNSDLHIRIFGSINLATEMFYTFKGKLSFESSFQSNTITTHGMIIQNWVSFSGPGGWELLDDLHVNSTIYLDNGSFSTNHQNITCNSIFSAVYTATQPSYVNLTSSTIYVKYESEFWLDSLNFNSGTSAIFIQGQGAYFGCRHNLLFNRVIFTDTSRFYCNIGNWVSFRSLITLGNAQFYGTITSDSLTLTAGYYYLLNTNLTINNYIFLDGTCGKTINLEGIEGTTIHASNGFISGNYLILENIQGAGGASFIANNSIDLGGNTGWLINSPSPRNLYWVNNGGNWNDNNHWSLSSNGLGGACLPTPIDHVFFDQNSFSLSGQIVTLDAMRSFCKNMSWNGVQNTPLIEGFNNSDVRLKIYGSLHLSSEMVVNYNFYFDFSSVDSANTIYAPVDSPMLFMFSGRTGKWELASELKNVFVYLNNGALYTKGYSIKGTFYGWNWNCNAKLVLDSSIIHGDLILADCVDFDCGTSTLYSTGLFANHKTFNRVVLAYEDWWSEPVNGEQNHFNSLWFTGDGFIEGSNTFDTLIFTAGKTYKINSLTNQTINHQLNIRGNNCAPISLHSSQPGSLATISVPSGTVTGDFLELQDIQATGGASFFAGNFSTDLGNNPGWTWGNAPGYVYGFPTDTTICQGDTLILKTDNFNGGTSWLWQDGSTSPAFTVTQSGTYSCRVTYAENCYIRDSIHVTVNPVPQAAAVPMSQVICSGATATIGLMNTNNVPGTSFSWTASLQSGSQTTGFASGSGNLISQTVTNTGSGPSTVIYTVTPSYLNCHGTTVSPLVTVKVHASSISGKLKYDNEFNTPLSCSKVYLKTSAGVVIDSSSTDQNGNYRFCDVPNGSYKLIATSSRPWGGVNAVDALLTLKYFAHLHDLTGLHYIAGDVNNSGYINSVDALLMATQYVEMTNSFIIGDWQFEKPTVTLTQITDLTVDILGLCTGDVNGSYIPPGCGP